MLFRMICAYLLLVLSLTSCGDSSSIVKGSGKIVRQDRKLDAFDKIMLSGAGTLILRQADTTGVAVETDDNLQEYIRTNVNFGTLNIDMFKNISLSPSKGIIYYVDFKELNNIEVSGAATLRSADLLNIKELKVSLSGAGNLNLKIKADKVVISLAGSGNIVLEGEVREEDITVSGAGSYKGFNLKAQTADVAVSGVGNAEVNASNELTADISGVGSVLYKGTPSLKQSISGVGAVRHSD